MNGAEITYGHDDLGRVTQIVETDTDTTRTFDYAYDAIGQLISMTDGATTTYECAMVEWRSAWASVAGADLASTLTSSKLVDDAVASPRSLLLVGRRAKYDPARSARPITRGALVAARIAGIGIGAIAIASRGSATTAQVTGQGLPTRTMRALRNVEPEVWDAAISETVSGLLAPRINSPIQMLGGW